MRRLLRLPFHEWTIPADYPLIALFALLIIVFDGMVTREKIRDLEAFVALWLILLALMVLAALLLEWRGVFLPYLFLSFLPFSVSLLGKVPGYGGFPSSEEGRDQWFVGRCDDANSFVAYDRDVHGGRDGTCGWAAKEG